MKMPLSKRRPATSDATTADSDTPLTHDDHVEQSRQAQRQADKWLIAGTVLMGMTLPGIIGLPIFLRGLALLRRAGREGLSVRPMIVTLIGYMVFLDAALNCFGWALDTIASNSALWQTMIMGWGNIFDGGYFWHYNQLPWVSGAGAPGEKAWEVTCVLTVFAMRMAACIGLLRMKRWGHQWMIVTCWFGVVIWIGYTTNMTLFADIRYAHTVLPVIGWWLYDIFYITPFLSIPYLHTVNREVFSD